MTKYIIFHTLLLGIICNIVRAEADAGSDNNWSRFNIRLSSEANLKDIFDSGLRPYRFPSLETTMLEAKHVYANFILKDGSKLPEYKATTLTIGVRNHGLLSYIELQSPRKSLEESKVEMMRWINFGTHPVRTENDLDQFIHEVKNDPIMYNKTGGGFTDYFRIRWKDENGFWYNVWFHQIANVEKPLAVFMKITFPRPPSPNSFYNEPIPPPPGYENEDMSAPNNFGPDQIAPIQPKDSHTYNYKLLVDDARNDFRPPASSYDSLSKKPQGSVDDKFKIPIWLMIVIALASIVVTIMLVRQNNI